jgi:hypothetical protein
MSPPEVARFILRRRLDAIFLPFYVVGLKGTGPENPDWVPLEQQCHANVYMWLRYNLSHRELRGYLLLEPQRRGLPWTIMPHTAVILTDGMAIDITPRVYPDPQPFVLHIGTAEQWEMMKEAQLVEVS